MLKFSLLNSFSLIELWLCIHFIIILVACANTTFYYFPIITLLCPSVRFTIGMVLSTVITAFAPPENKKQILLGGLRRSFEGYVQIHLEGSEIDFRNKIIVANYPSCFLEYLFLPITLDGVGKKFCLVVGKSAAPWASKFLPPENLLILDKKKNFETLKSGIQHKLAQGITPIIYPEVDAWKRRTPDELMPFRSGVFTIAQELEAGILVARVPHIRHILGIVTNNMIKISLKAAEDASKETVRQCFLENVY